MANLLFFPLYPLVICILALHINMHVRIQTDLNNRASHDKPRKIEFDNMVESYCPEQTVELQAPLPTARQKQ